jgi:hypothetical protein
LADQPARRIGKRRQPLRQIRARICFGMGNKIEQDAVEQVDMLGAVISRPPEKQLGNPPGRVSLLFGIAAFNNGFEPGDQRSRGCQQTYSKTPAWHDDRPEAYGFRAGNSPAHEAGRQPGAPNQKPRQSRSAW